MKHDHLEKQDVLVDVEILLSLGIGGKAQLEGVMPP